MEKLQKQILSGEKLLSTINFALGTYDKDMSLTQLKLQVFGVSQININDDPFDDKLYEIKLDQLAKIMQIDESSLVRNIHTAGDKLINLNPVFAFADDDTDKVSRITVFDRIDTDRKNKVTRIGYSRWFRQAVIKMKKVYDISMPTDTIASFKCKYSLLLYPFLLAQAAILRRDGVGKDNRYDIFVPIEDLKNTMKYPGPTFKFHEKALGPACKDLNQHSQIHIDGDMPEILHEPGSKKTAGYIFHVTIQTTVTAPMFAALEKIDAPKRDIPPMDYILKKLEELGVASTFIKSVEKLNDPQYTWKTYIYTINQGPKGTPRYFNAAFKKTWAYEADLEKIFKQALNNVPGFADEVTFGINKYYDSLHKEKKIEYVLDDNDFVKAPKGDNRPIKERLEDLKRRMAVIMRP